MPKRSIPNIPRSSADSDRRAFDVAMKENLELITGQRGTKINSLASTATTADIIKKINELIDLLQ
ncbi:MAG: hypothetical protein K2X63_04435 [Burkholderiaceae bacterium]|nr:hypothetical protein [Burkholderiaceae bacterium]